MENGKNCFIADVIISLLMDSTRDFANLGVNTAVRLSHYVYPICSGWIYICNNFVCVCVCVEREKRTATFAILNVPLEYELLPHWWTHKCNGTLMKIFSINPQFPDRNEQKGDATIDFHCTFLRYEANSGLSSCIFSVLKMKQGYHLCF